MQAFILPRNLVALAKLTTKSTRYALDAIHLRLRGDRYIAEASDARYAARVAGPAAPADAHVQALPELADAPNSASAALVPSKDWETAFKSVPKGKAAARRPDLAEGLACVMGPAFTTLGGADGSGAQTVLQPPHAEGRFPNLDGIFPEGAPTATVQLDALRLAELLKAAAAFAAPEDSYPVTLEVRGPRTPVVVKASINGQEFTGVIAPLVV